METLISYHSCIALLMGFLLDCIIGDPYVLPHPVRWIGRFVSFLEKRLYGDKGLSAKRRFMRGCVLVLLVLSVTAGMAFFFLSVSYAILAVLGIAVESVVCLYCVAAKNLRDESMNVHECLKAGNLDAARNAVSRIVGRDTNVLDETGVAKAAVETVAESLTDGVVAPLFYVALGGGVLGMVHKAVNTMDSMIGYKNERYGSFGTAAAHTDDAFAFVPARIAAFAMMAAAALLRYDAKKAFGIWKRDRFKHASPNSAQTESACAGALHIQLAGDAYYEGKLEHKPLIGDRCRPVEFADIRRANRLMYVSSLLCLFVFAAARILFL